MTDFLAGATRGIGRVLAHWIMTGRPDVDVTGFNIDRLHPYQSNPEYRRTRTVESLGMVYQCHYPTRSMMTAPVQISASSLRMCELMRTVFLRSTASRWISSRSSTRVRGLSPAIGGTSVGAGR